MRLSSLRTLLFGLALAGCASGGAAGSTAGGSGHQDPNLITSAELVKANAPTVYAAIQQLRPQMLRQRFGTSTSSINSPQDYAIKVYLDGQPLGGVDEMKTIAASTIKEVQFLTADQAQQRFGSGNPGGVIILTSR